MSHAALFSGSSASPLPRDIVAYRQGYPDAPEDDITACHNREFYTGTRECLPDKLMIDQFYTEWFGDYEALEFGHGWVQWLFPIREHGMNSQAQPLQQHEITFLRTDATARARLIRSLELILDFWGMRIVSVESGEVTRSKQYRERYVNLVRNGHNFLRVTRVLKCLGEVGLEQLQLGICLHLARELRQQDSLLAQSSSVRRAAHTYWFHTLRDKAARDTLAAEMNLTRPSNEKNDGVGHSNSDDEKEGGTKINSEQAAKAEQE
jgi:hypothetical protein